MTPEEAMTRAPAQIRKVQLEAYDAKRRAEGARLRLRAHEADALLALQRRSKEDPALKNEAGREAALRRLLEADPEAQGLRRQVAEEEALARRIEAHAEYLENVQRNARVLLLSRSPANLVFEGAEP